MLLCSRQVAFREIPVDGLFQRCYSWHGNCVTYRKVAPVEQFGKMINSIFVDGRRSPDENQNSWMDDDEMVGVK